MENNLKVIFRMLNPRYGKYALYFFCFLIGRLIRQHEKGCKNFFLNMFQPQMIRKQDFFPAFKSQVQSNVNSSNCFHIKYPCVKQNINFQTHMHPIPPTVPTDLFSYLHHPSTPAKKSLLLTANFSSPDESNVYIGCDEIYMTRTGSRSSQPNKCVAIVKIPDGMESIVQLGHRIGITALTLNQYQKDYPRDEALGEEEQLLLPPMLSEMKTLQKQFETLMGNPIDSVTGNRKSVVVMVANEGVIDLVLNFICSAEQIGYNLEQVIVFVGNNDYVSVIESMGPKAIYSEALGSMPKEAAAGYLDHTFSRMMWFKTTSVYLALKAGFNVLFQDADLVWLKDPVEYLEKHDGDIIFMDDGARTPRYTPLFVNSGFYFLKYNERTLYFQEKMLKGGPSEIGYSHSHQQVLTRHLSETLHLIGLQIRVLEIALFPSGQAYHEDKKYMNKVIKREYRPYVFHMCWTDNRVNKVVFFKEVGLWYLPDSPSCIQPQTLLEYNTGTLRNGKVDDIKTRCCLRDRYWPKE